MNQTRRQLEAELQKVPAESIARLDFCAACISRVSHLIERDDAKTILEAFLTAVAERRRANQLAPLAAEAAIVARNHAGSPSIDGTGHASVSATHALARAVAGDAVGTADYAAYAATYAYGGYAVKDPAALEPEYRWQLEKLERLAGPA